jgi:hypothetical protein
MSGGRLSFDLTSDQHKRYIDLLYADPDEWPEGLRAFASPVPTTKEVADWVKAGEPGPDLTPPRD